MQRPAFGTVRKLSGPPTGSVWHDRRSQLLALSATELIYGDELVEHMSVTVSSKYSGLKPTGTVTVSESSMALCTITLSAGSGSCTLSPRRLAVGTYDVIAAYSGDKSFEPSATGDRLTVVA